ncbi:MAG: NAD-dependent epimerase/dehydratase family protein [Flavobacteriales bacterium]
MKKALIIGAGGQIGTELTLNLIDILGHENVLATDVRPLESELLKDVNCLQLDVLDKEALTSLVVSEQITEIYHLAATLSATAEKNPEFAWHLNMQSLFHVLNLGKEKLVEKIFWPSSIAVFGPDTPQNNTPQNTLTNPTTVYGISKLSGERWCQYYHEKYGVDVRSLRFPGLLGYKAEPGGGTTDYALWALKNAAEKKPYISFISKQTELPMMHMEDAIKGILDLMNAKSNAITVRSSYNISGFSFTPEELEAKIKKHASNFKLEYLPDFRQDIAESWPNSLCDDIARKDWNWNPNYNFDALVVDILGGFKKKLLVETR